MSINLKEATEFMLEAGYIIPVGRGKYKLTTKFHTEYSKARQAAIVKDITPLGPRAYLPELANYVPPSWEDMYKQFIIDARVPKRLEARDGSYQANAYSEEGMKAFRKAIESGTDLQLLIRATQLYYGGTIRYKQAIGRFMSEGTWKTHYDELQAAASAGTEQLIAHIKTETKDEHSSYRIG